MAQATEPDRTAWLMIAVGDDRQHGGNDGYDDDADVHYSWDSTVANHAAVSTGDQVVLWNKHQSLGASVIEEIKIGNAVKLRYRCPSCTKASIKRRRTLTPAYKCYKCSAEFDHALEIRSHVTTYRSRHDAGWVNLKGVLSGGELRALCVSPQSQLSIRPLRWDAFVATVRSKLPDMKLDL
jgi:ribosomal protein L37AE/L43A